MSADHTPGPWNAPNGGPYVTAKGNFVICLTANTVNQVAFAAGVGSLEDRANARLIAQSPALLEALERISRTDVNSFQGDNQRFHAWLKAFTEDTVSKAKGGP